MHTTFDISLNLILLEVWLYDENAIEIYNKHRLRTNTFLHDCINII